MVLYPTPRRYHAVLAPQPGATLCPLFSQPHCTMCVPRAPRDFRGGCSSLLPPILERKECVAISLRDAGPPERGDLTRAGKWEAAFCFLKGLVEVAGRELAEETWQWPAGRSRANRQNCHTGCWARGFQERWGGEGGWAPASPSPKPSGGLHWAAGTRPSWVELVRRGSRNQVPAGCLHSWTWAVGSGQGPAKPDWAIPGLLVGAFPTLCNSGRTMHPHSHVSPG